MTTRKQDIKLAKMIEYMLARSPGEFGLVPNDTGYVKIKELIKALHEENGWRHVKASTLEILKITVDDVPFEISGDLIRAKNRSLLSPPATPDEPLPKILYTCVRQRAYHRVTGHGIPPSGTGYVVLSPDKKLAQRIGKRRDPNPVALVVETRKAIQNGVRFQKADGEIFLADFIPPGCFTGPQLSTHVKKIKASTPQDKKKEAKPHDTAGSFIMLPPPDKKSAKGKKKKIEWKKERRKARSKKHGYAQGR